MLDEDYLAHLRGVHQAPPVLFARGALVRDDPAVSVAESRKASERGLSITAGVTRGLVSRGVTVVAGLALGTDTAAPRASLAVDHDDTRASLRVTDTGCGIPAGKIERIFDRFERLTPIGRLDPHNGSGIGLTIARPTTAS